jgi:hypothetical protein
LLGSAIDSGDDLDVAVDMVAETLGGMIVNTWNPRTTTGSVSISVGIARIESLLYSDSILVCELLLARRLDSPMN